MKKNDPNIVKSPMSSVTVTPCPHGVHGPMSHESITTHDYFNQPPSPEIISEAVSTVVAKMMRSGFDPALPNFVLLITFN
jgi:hypothetical protein